MSNNSTVEVTKTATTTTTTSVGTGTSTTTSIKLRPIILCFGDSITQYGYGIPESNNIGWISLLSSTYTRRCDIINRGYSGYNTNNALSIIDNILPSTSNNNNNNNILFCTLFFGANDAVMSGNDQHVPIKEYCTNIKKIIQIIRQRTSKSTPIIIITPPPIVSSEWAKSLNIPIEQSNRSNDNAKLYSTTIQYELQNNIEFVSDNYITIIDMWELCNGSGTDTERLYYLYDGLHLNENGNHLLYNNLLQTITKKFPHCLPLNDNEDEYNTDTTDTDTTKTKTGIPMDEKPWKEFYKK